MPNAAKSGATIKRSAVEEWVVQLTAVSVPICLSQTLHG
jgi:hypothetical protein